MCQSYTTQRVQRPNLKAVIIHVFQAKPSPTGAVENPPTTPAALGTQPNAPATTDPQKAPRTPATPQKARTQVETECSVIPAWKLFATDW